jgi:hypothetical protein
VKARVVVRNQDNRNGLGWAAAQAPTMTQVATETGLPSTSSMSESERAAALVHLSFEGVLLA